jgi:hypothetical protein
MLIFEGGKPENPEKNPQSKREKQQTTQLTYDVSTIIWLHVTSSPPCWRTLTKYFSFVSFVYGTNMAAMSLSSHSLGKDCNPKIL